MVVLRLSWFVRVFCIAPSLAFGYYKCSTRTLLLFRSFSSERSSERSLERSSERSAICGFCVGGFGFDGSLRRVLFRMFSVDRSLLIDFYFDRRLTFTYLWGGQEKWFFYHAYSSSSTSNMLSRFFLCNCTIIM